MVALRRRDNALVPLRTGRGFGDGLAGSSGEFYPAKFFAR
jgi:hypothetical protein